MPTMTIDGNSVQGDGAFGVVNPATGTVFADAPVCSRAQLDDAMNSAAAAYPVWRADLDARRNALRKAAETLAASTSELAPLLSSEQGKPIGSMGLGDAAFEVQGSAMWLQYTAEITLPPEVIQDDDAAHVEVVRRPLGVVAAITPWNYPILLACMKIGPALLAGNTMVLKPSPFTPLATLKMGEILSSVLPPGVLNVVSGGDELGAWMTSHPAVRKVSFTGSVATGKAVAAAAAPDLKRVTLELGGNDPAIVLDDADVATVADGLFWGAMTNCGQICTAIKRVYVPRRLHGQLVDALADRARSVKVGIGTEPDTQMGPINNLPQLNRVTELVNDAILRGAKVAAGGGRIDSPGYFFQPTVLSEVSDGVRIVDEEQFGPVLPVVAYDDVEDALRRANDTHFGLSGSVWGGDPDRAADVASKLECGTSWVNCHLAVGPHIPFGGSKWSGTGVENGPWGMLGFTEIQVLYRPKA
jgi:acyl-CoA reductase-like NAD-dependent aldehyde dehydrogenase